MGLSELGFTALQERVYRTLLDVPDTDPTTLADQLGCGGPALRSALDALIELGVARTDAAAAATVTLHHPAVALGQLIEQREDELLRVHRRVGDTRAEVAELATRFAGRSPATEQADGMERIDDLEQVRRRLEELAFFTRTSVYAAQPGGPLSKETLAASRPLDLQGLRRGIDMRIIYNTKFLAEAHCRAYLREISAAGAHVRVTDEALERMIIMDERVAVMPVDPLNSQQGALIVKQPGLVTGFLRLFSRLWEDSTPWFAEENTELEAALTVQDRQVLRLLAAGNTDEIVAREVGVSVRHLRRRVARLMDRLGASSRFEAGVEAARRGWT